MHLAALLPKRRVNLLLRELPRRTRGSRQACAVDRSARPRVLAILCHRLKLPAHDRQQVNAEHCRNRKTPAGHRQRGGRTAQDLGAVGPRAHPAKAIQTIWEGSASPFTGPSLMRERLRAGKRGQQHQAGPAAAQQGGNDRNAIKRFAQSLLVCSVSCATQARLRLGSGATDPHVATRALRMAYADLTTRCKRMLSLLRAQTAFSPQRPKTDPRCERLWAA